MWKRAARLGKLEREDRASPEKTTEQAINRRACRVSPDGMFLANAWSSSARVRPAPGTTETTVQP